MSIYHDVTDDSERHQPEPQTWRRVPQPDGSVVLLLVFPEYADTDGTLLTPHGGTYRSWVEANRAIETGEAWRTADAFMMRQLGRDQHLYSHDDADV